MRGLAQAIEYYQNDQKRMKYKEAPAAMNLSAPVPSNPPAASCSVA